MKVSDYLPELYKNNLEMTSIINSEEYELETNLKTNLDTAFLNTFASEANVEGIERFETFLDIKPNPDDSLQLRRERVINRLTRQIPYTERFLISRLNAMLGEGSWNYTFDYNNYTLTINSVIPGKNWYNEVIEFLNMIIPCNIIWSVIIYAASWDLVNNHFASWEEIYNEEMTWQELMDAEWSR